jgi:hypothetical protein
LEKLLCLGLVHLSIIPRQTLYSVLFAVGLLGVNRLAAVAAAASDLRHPQDDVFPFLKLTLATMLTPPQSQAHLQRVHPEVVF